MNSIFLYLVGWDFMIMHFELLYLKGGSVGVIAYEWSDVS